VAPALSTKSVGRYVGAVMYLLLGDKKCRTNFNTDTSPKIFRPTLKEIRLYI
jgi:hypothetical protein